MTQPKTAIQVAFNTILDDYGQGKRRFEYDHYPHIDRPTFRQAIHKLAQKSNQQAVRKPKPYYLISPLAYEIVTHLLPLATSTNTQ